MVANRAFQAPLQPEISALRVDPYDSQGGEVELIGSPVPFTMRQIDGKAKLIKMEDL